MIGLIALVVAAATPIVDVVVEAQHHWTMAMVVVAVLHAMMMARVGHVGGY